jgi:hypothetical protein
MWGGMIGLDNPTWTDAVVAVDDGVTLRDAVRITMGSFVRPSWGTPEPATVSGVEVEVYTGTWADEVTTVVLPGDPQLSVSGRDPIGYLEAVGASPVGDVQVGDDGTISFAVRTIPDEYQVIVEPTPLQRGSVDAVTQAGDGEAADGMAAFVSLQNPLVTIAPISDLERVDINGIDAWLFDMDPGAQVLWPASGATWVSVSGAATVDTTLAFARSIELVDQATWSARYDVLSARYPSAEPPESGEPMTTDQPASATAPAGTTSPHSGALVIARTEVGSLPTESPIGCGEAPSTDESLGDAPVADSADAALAAFLGTNRAQTLFTNGYELLTTSGSSTHRYERRNDSGSVVTVIVVEPASGGWRASRVQASPC